MLMPNGRCGATIQCVPVSAHANAPVGLLPVEEVRFVDQADPANRIAADEQARANEVIEGDRRIVERLRSLSASELRVVADDREDVAASHRLNRRRGVVSKNPRADDADAAIALR